MAMDTAFTNNKDYNIVKDRNQTLISCESPDIMEIYGGGLNVRLKLSSDILTPALLGYHEPLEDSYKKLRNSPTNVRRQSM
jgi:hypothetical protein